MGWYFCGENKAILSFYCMNPESPEAFALYLHLEINKASILQKYTVEKCTLYNAFWHIPSLCIAFKLTMDC